MIQPEDETALNKHDNRQQISMQPENATIVPICIISAKQVHQRYSR